MLQVVDQPVELLDRRLAVGAHHGVKIDECPRCGGVFLDRGELEILEHFDDPGPARRFIAGLFGLRR